MTHPTAVSPVIDSPVLPSVLARVLAAYDRADAAR